MLYKTIPSSIKETATNNVGFIQNNDEENRGILTQRLLGVRPKEFLI